MNFGGAFKCSETRAASRLSYLFTVTKQLRRDIKRVYVYNWTGDGCRGGNFDAGLTEPGRLDAQGLLHRPQPAEELHPVGRENAPAGLRRPVRSRGSVGHSRPSQLDERRTPQPLPPLAA